MVMFYNISLSFHALYIILQGLQMIFTNLTLEELDLSDESMMFSSVSRCPGDYELICPIYDPTLIEYDRSINRTSYDLTPILCTVTFDESFNVRNVSEFSKYKSKNPKTLVAIHRLCVID